MPSNIEIKARVRDFESLRKKIEALSDVAVKILEQEDTFFNTKSGRLKLRETPGLYAELIYYERPDSIDPAESQYCLIKIDEPEALKNALQAAIGIRGVVRKTRRLYRTGQARLHLDEVEKLGYYLEVEVVLQTDQSPEEGKQIAQDLMQQIGIKPSDLVQSAYIDLLEIK